MFLLINHYGTFITCHLLIMLLIIILPFVELKQNISIHIRKITDHLYCDPSLCELYNGSHTIQATHIACHNSGNIEPDCGKQAHLIRMDMKRRNLILSMHNLMRSRIALGNLDGYSTASRMPILRWDNELEFLAELNVKRCIFDHDECHNTPRFRYSGQNIGHFWINRQFKSHTKRIRSFILSWFNEYHDANETFINRFHRHPEGKQIEHFTLMVSDRARRIGCAAIHYRDPYKLHLYKFLLTCNYDFSNLLMEPIYEIGPTRSKCNRSGFNKRYPGLCD